MKDTRCIIHALALLLFCFCAMDAGARIVEKQLVDLRHLAYEPIQLDGYEHSEGNVKVLLGRQFNNAKTDYPKYDPEKQALIYYHHDRIRIETVDGALIDSICFSADMKADVVFHQAANSTQSAVDGEFFPFKWETYPDKQISYVDFFLVYPNNTHIEVAYFYDFTVYTSRDGEPGLDPSQEPMDMELVIDDVYGHMATVGIVEFTLNVTNDDGIKNFTLIAHDPDNAAREYCNMDFDRSSFVEIEEFEMSTEKSGDEEMENRSYSIHGTAKLTKLGRNEETPLHIYALANYDDGTNKSTAQPIVSVVNTVGLTGVFDTEVEDDSCLVYYNLYGIEVADPVAPGIYIMRKGDSVRKVIR